MYHFILRFKSVKNTSKFNEDFRKNYKENWNTGYIHVLHNDLPFLTKNENWKG